MSAGEVITTSSTGGQKAGNNVRASLIPWAELLEVAELYGKGALKYEDHNWMKGYDWHLSFDALIRHLSEWWLGNEYDDGEGGTGLEHLTAVVFHAFALMYFRKHFPQFDDRPNTVLAKRAELTKGMAEDPRETTTLEPEWTRKYEWCINDDDTYPYRWMNDTHGEGWYYQYPADSGKWCWSTENRSPGNNIGHYDRFTRV
ncbi:hypothetical protein SEA_ESTES_87 [Mycobacterium phage Estes]|uniref:dATP/dGTP diphosphohydrolase N-terminal domain-containing protein n=1 Tax=Mycobacterium phage Estes TaxID=2759459 RepID=A0A7G9A2F7_9CAUD|nr:hypothetical protein J4U03_gp087 [Mycobacterium phage Estes]QNL30796.1 hypothetical protein SEA_ESTES_87 [Mycobacterium phage Estes]